MLQKDIHINKCIYCGDVGQTDEHVIPRALGGTMMLRKASCEVCRDITSKCERRPLYKNLAEARAVLDYPSRKRNFNNERFNLDVVLRDGTSTILSLKKDEVLGLVSFFEYSLPGFFDSLNYKNGINVVACTTIQFGADLKVLSDKYNIKQITHKSKHEKSDFEKMIINIAYRFTVLYAGLESFKECLVLPTILEEKDDIGFWIGCDNEGLIIPLIGKVGGPNAIRIGEWRRFGDDNRYVIVRIKLFAGSDAPEYIVVVGTLKHDFIPLKF